MTVATDHDRAASGGRGPAPGRPVREITVRPLAEGDLDAADCVFRLAFGTMLGLPDPGRFAEGAEVVRTRWAAPHVVGVAAEVDGRVVGSAFARRWGSLALLGPLSVHPDHWDRGVGKRLWEARLPILERWGVRDAGLFTNSQGTKHIHLYQKFGFWPRFLTALVAKEVGSAASPRSGWTAYSRLAERDRARSLEACRDLADAIEPGLDPEGEILGVARQVIGETILLWTEE